MKHLFFSVLCSLSLAALSLSAGGCDNTPTYSDYVSEYRSEIYLTEAEGVSLSVFFTAREYPYAADGIRAGMEDLVEIYLTAPDNTKEYTITFPAEDGKTYGGEMAYDSVHARFFYSQSLAAASAAALVFLLTYDGETLSLRAERVRTGNELPMPALLETLADQKKELFSSLTANGVFCGEIRVRLVYNEQCYYFLSVTDTEKRTDCFLLDACTGKVLAEKTA